MQNWGRKELKLLSPYRTGSKGYSPDLDPGCTGLELCLKPLYSTYFPYEQWPKTHYKFIIKMPLSQIEIKKKLTLELNYKENSIFKS